MIEFFTLLVDCPSQEEDSIEAFEGLWTLDESLVREW